MTSPSASATPSQPKRRRATSRLDIINLYRLAIGRDPESEDAVQRALALGMVDLVPAYFGAPEFNDRILVPLSAGRSPWPIAEGPDDALVDWAASRLPLSPAGRRAVAASGTRWPTLFHALLTDPTFAQAARDLPVLAPSILEALSGLVRVDGQVERIDVVSIAGWAIAARPEDGPVRIEIWIDGSPVASGLADQFRRTRQDSLGGDGRVGFDIALGPEALVGLGEALIEVRAGPERVVIGSGRLMRRGPDISRLEQLCNDVTALRKQLDRLEAALPVMVSEAGSDLTDYASYYETWYRSASFSRPASATGAVLIVLDGWGRTAAALQRSCRAIVGQLTAPDRLVILADAEGAFAAEDIAARARWISDGGIEVLVSQTADPGERVYDALAANVAGDVVLLTDADVVLHPACLSLVVDRLTRDAVVQALYFDEDGVEAEGPLDPALRRHVDPILRPGPDRDLLLQTPYCGATLAFRRATLDRIGLKPGCDGLHGCDALLRLEAMPGAIGHIPAVMVTRLVPGTAPDASTWRACIQRELTRVNDEATVEPHVDPLAAIVPGAVRIRHRVPAVTASVIIPTRDGLDLLKPCIDSILAHRGANAVELDLIVIDHESRDPATLNYLHDLAAQERATVLPFAGAFNWALMNNRAAAGARGELLVFLNNDTLVLSPDWLDVLAAQAMRADVGVVGARLIYGDGTIQHAGFLARDTAPDFLIHDGVGLAGSDGGYLGRHALVHATPAVTGACMAVSAEVFRNLGGFDAAELPVEGNDVDLCFRAQAAGLSVLYEPAATLYHLESKSRGFAFSGPEREVSKAASALVRERWGERFGEDPGFNPHFDRIALPFTRLRPPPLRHLTT